MGPGPGRRRGALRQPGRRPVRRDVHQRLRRPRRAAVHASLSAGCLAGVTRQLVTEACEVVERDLSLAELAGAEEAFLTSSTREVQPIRAVDASPLPAVPGSLTRAAAEALAALIVADIDP